MSDKSNEILTSWVFVDQGKESDKLTEDDEDVENVVEAAEVLGDSDSDSISIISESGGSHKEDVDEVSSLLLTRPETEDGNEEADDLQHEEYTENLEEIEILKSTELMNIESKRYIDYFIDSKWNFCSTSSFYILLLIAVSIALQHYYDAVFVNNIFTQPNDFTLSNPSHMKTNSYITKKSKSEINHNNECKLTTPVYNKDNDHYKRDLKSNFKPSKNKKPVRQNNKENKSKRKFLPEQHSQEISREQYYEQKLKELKLKEAYLNEQQNQGILRKQKYEKKLKELELKEDYLNKKEKNLTEAKEHELNKIEMLLNSSKKFLKKCDNRGKELEVLYKEMKKIIKANHKSKENYKSSSTSKHKFNNYEEQRKRNISGQWYMKLHKARRDLRHKEHASDWVFDRARLRSTKRNKAYWYFQWMVDRSRHRMK